MDLSSLNFPQLEQQYGLPSGLLNAVAMTESNGNPAAVSKTGAQGLFQFMPATAKQYGVDPLDPQQSAQGAAKYYSDLLKKNNGNLDMALASYNFGPGNVAAGKPLPAETQAYIAKVKGMLPTQVADSGQIKTDATVDNRPSLDQIFSNDANARPSLDEIFASPGNPNSSDASKENKTEPSFVERVTQDLKKRWQEGLDARQAYDTGQQGAAQLGLQILGKPFAGSVADIATEGAKSLYNLLPENAQKKVSQAGDYIANDVLNLGSDISPLKALSEQYGDFAKENPNAARSIESIGNLATLLPIGKTGEGIAGVGKAIEQGGINRAANNRLAAIQKMVLPPETGSVGADNAKRTTVNALGSKVYNPTAQEQQIAKTVAETGVSPSNTMQKNLNIVQQANTKEAQDLQAFLQKKDVYIPDDVIINKLASARDTLANNPYIVGDGAKAADNVINNALDIIQKNPQTASGLLQSRKDLDKWITSQKGEKTFNPALDTPITQAVQQVRQTINDMISNAVPRANVKASLAKQFNLYRAADNMAPKAAKEAATVIGRAGQKIKNAVDLKSLLLAGGGGALAGLTGGAAIPAIAGAAALYGLQKGIRSPLTQRAVGMGIKGVGNVVRAPSALVGIR